MDHPFSDSDVRRPLAPHTWRDLNGELEAWFRGHQEIRSQAHRQAERIFGFIKWLDPFFERYERESYTHCTAPCCTARRVFFDRADLLSSSTLSPKPSPRPRRGPSRANSVAISHEEVAPCRVSPGLTSVTGSYATFTISASPANREESSEHSSGIWRNSGIIA